jgi:TolA-binding protein
MECPKMMPFRKIIFISLIGLGLVLLTGCESNDMKAQNMLSQGQYQQVIDQFPDTQYALRAEALLAESLLKDGKLAEVIEKYPNTPAAHTAKLAEAQKLYDSGNYEAVIEKYPHSTLADQSKRIVSDSLYAAGAYDELLEKYGDSEKGKLVTNERAAEAFEKAKKMTGQAKINALEQITQKYRGSDSFKEAASMLRDLRTPKK